MAESQRQLREQMTAAMEKIRHQLELLREGPTIGGALDNRDVIAGLEAEFEALREARANLAPDEH
jgi:hypothetical protein